MRKDKEKGGKRRPVFASEIFKTPLKEKHNQLLYVAFLSFVILAV
mgnify:CR=1 FL=1